MLALWLVLYVIFLHWVFDFACQTDNMAINKSKSWYWLCVHCATYCLLGLFVPTGSILMTAALVVYLFVTHVCVDAVTSRINAKLWAEKKVRLFFTMIGLDQFIHYATLFWFIDRFCK